MAPVLMMSSIPAFASLLVLLISSGVVIAADEDPLQDFCVADIANPLTINGRVCKASNSVVADDFKSDCLVTPGPQIPKLGLAVKASNVENFCGVNTQGISSGRLDFCPGGVNPPHIHPRATELLFCLQGTLKVGFIDTENKLFVTTICKGEQFVFPRGLIHFQLNIGHEEAIALTAFNSQNPGVSQVAKAVFNCEPPLPDEVIRKAFQLYDVEEARKAIRKT